MAETVSCFDCKYSGIEPGDMNPTCRHEIAGQLGLHVSTARAENAKCGPDGTLFEKVKNETT